MKDIRTIIIDALDIQDLPENLQDDVIEKTAEGLMQSVMSYAYMTLSETDQKKLTEKLDKDEDTATLFSWLQTKLPNLNEVVADSLARYAMA